MKILDRYIGVNVVVSIVLVMCVLLALFSIFNFIDELRDVGRGHYAISDAILYVLLLLPSLIYQLLPMSALIGCTIGLGMLASNSELVVVRSIGVSLNRIIFAVLKAAMFVLIVAIIVGEWLAPQSERLAKTLRSTAISEKISMKGRDVLWARDGNQIVNVRHILPGQRLGQVYIYQIQADHSLKQIVAAQSAAYQNGSWVLKDVSYSQFSDAQVSGEKRAEVKWDTTLSPDLLNVVTVKPTSLSSWGLMQYIEHLRANGLSANVYLQSLWARIMQPFVTIAMVLLSIPFVFGPLRSVGIGQRVFVGVLIGIGFHLFNQSFAYIGLISNMGPVASAILPAFMAIAVAIGLLKKVH